MAVIEKYLQDKQIARLLDQEELILQVTEMLCGLLAKEQITRQELAARLGKSKGFVSQLLNGGRNLTLRTLADILHVLGYQLQLRPYKRETENKRGCQLDKRHTWGDRVSQPLIRWRLEKVSVPDNYPEQLAISI